MWLTCDPPSVLMKQRKRRIRGSARRMSRLTFQRSLTPINCHKEQSLVNSRNQPEAALMSSMSVWQRLWL